MENWRGLLAKLGLVPVAGVGREAGGAHQPETVEPDEVALILLNSASRLLDQAMAPPQVRASLETAVRELERHIAARSR